MSDLSIHEIDGIDAVLEPYDWVFAREHAEAITRTWDAEKARKPELFNGRVLIQHRGELDGRIFRCGYSETDYRVFLSWHRLGYPPPAVRNGFAMAALQTRDGAFLLGEMGSHTANAGKIYFAAGTPDLDDVRDGRVDLAGSVLRELSEETGLQPEEVEVGAGWTILVSPMRAAFMRPVFLDMMAEDARRLMLSRMATLEDQELADIHIVRGPGQIDEARMPPFQQAFLRHAFGR